MNIENKRQLVIILFAVALGLGAAVLTGNYIQTSIQEAEAQQLKKLQAQTIEPLKQEIAMMRQQISDLASRPMVAAGGGQAAGQAATPKSTLSFLTPAGKRAYTVRIDPLSAVGGMINPGDIVDVLAHMNMPDPISGKTEVVSSMVFQNVRVLAVNTNLQATGGYEQQQAAPALNITFALTPEEASLISFLVKNAQLQLVLRGPQETEVAKLQKADWTSLAEYVYTSQETDIAAPLSQSKLKPDTEKKEEAKDYIEIYKGGQQQ